MEQADQGEDAAQENKVDSSVQQAGCQHGRFRNVVQAFGEQQERFADTNGPGGQRNKHAEVSGSCVNDGLLEGDAGVDRFQFGEVD